MRQSLIDYKFLKEQETTAYELYTQSAYWFYHHLLAPALTSKEDIEHLIIIPDGELGHLPFEAFLSEPVEEEILYQDLPYLLKKYRISYNYSANLWKENLTSPPNKNNGKILAIAAQYNIKGDSLRSRSNRAPHLLNLRDALNDLPAAKEEVMALSQKFIGEFWQKEQSNERNFKEKAGEFGIIHLAMHGLLNQRAPILSSLAFTENGDSSEDNFLEAWEISHLRLNAQLVVLSACETGYGRFQQGEGVMSLARSFMYAGVPSLVVSLWQVNDVSTSRIMQLFYQNLSKGIDKAEALRQAKLKYIASHTTSIQAHPAFWAAFVQIGDSRPINVATKGIGAMLWWIVGGIGLLLLGGLSFVLMKQKNKEI